MHEVQKYVAVSNHGYLVYGGDRQPGFLERPAPTIRRTLEGRCGMRPIRQPGREAGDDDALEAVRTRPAQVYTLSARRLAWKKVLLPVHREQAPRIGRDTIDAIYKATGFDASKLL